MKHKIKDKEFDIVHAKSRQIIELEKQLGHPIAQLDKNPSYESICRIYTSAIISSSKDPAVTEDWVLDSMEFKDMNIHSEVVAYFLAVDKN